jgi:hypothetical protein
LSSRSSQLFIGAHNETLSASQDRARIVFDCRAAYDPAMMSLATPAQTAYTDPRNDDNTYSQEMSIMMTPDWEDDCFVVGRWQRKTRTRTFFFTSGE